MGWDTYLYVGAVEESWRKHAPNAVALLLGETDFFVEGEIDDDVSPNDDDEEFFAGFRTTAARCIARLDSIGLDWNLFITFYAEARRGAFAEGMIIGRLVTDGEDEKGVEKILAEFAAIPPVDDLRALGRIWLDVATKDGEVNVEELPGLGEHHLPSALLKITGTETMEGYAAARALEFLGWLQQQAPDFGWLFRTRVLLEALPGAEAVEFDLSDHVRETLGLPCSGTRVSEYGLNYLRNSVEGLAAEARMIGRLYSVLSDAENRVGKNFWAGLASGLLTRIESGAGTVNQRGTLLEDLVEALVRMEPDVRVVEKKVLNDTGEIDLVLANQLTSPFWTNMQSPYIFFECKNWKDKAGAPEARVFESKLRERGNVCRIGICVSMSGFTDPAVEVFRRVQSQGLIIFRIGADDLRQMIGKRTGLFEWLIAAGTGPIM